MDTDKDQDALDEKVNNDDLEAVEESEDVIVDDEDLEQSDTDKIVDDVLDSLPEEEKEETDKQEDTEEKPSEEDAEKKGEDEETEEENPLADILSEDEEDQTQQSQKQVPYGALHEERSKRKALSQKVEQLEATVKELKSGKNQGRQTETLAEDPTDEEIFERAGVDPEEDLTAADYGKLRRAENAIRTERKQAATANQQENAKSDYLARVAAMQPKARARFSKETIGDGLDYDTVTTIGQRNLSQADKLAIFQADDPATEAYKRCIRRTPSLLTKASNLKGTKQKPKAKAEEKPKPKAPSRQELKHPSESNSVINDLLSDDEDEDY